jgi:hypothetical protein
MNEIEESKRILKEGIVAYKKEGEKYKNDERKTEKV